MIVWLHSFGVRNETVVVVRNPPGLGKKLRVWCLWEAE